MLGAALVAVVEKITVGGCTLAPDVRHSGQLHERVQESTGPITLLAASDPQVWGLHYKSCSGPSNRAVRLSCDSAAGDLADSLAYVRRVC
jgi:hypothetical protein